MARAWPGMTVPRRKPRCGPKWNASVGPDRSAGRHHPLALEAPALPGRPPLGDLEEQPAQPLRRGGHEGPPVFPGKPALCLFAGLVLLGVLIPDVGGELSGDLLSVHLSLHVSWVGELSAAKEWGLRLVANRILQIPRRRCYPRSER